MTKGSMSYQTFSFAFSGIHRPNDILVKKSKING